MPGQFLATMTWIEAAGALAEHAALLLPIGAACKEHGPHLPLNTDWLYADYLARRVVERCRVLSAPTIGYGYYPAFDAYPGSTSIGRDAFRDTVLGIARSFARHGMKNIYALNTGISTIPPLAEAASALAGEGVRLLYSDLRSLARDARAQVERQAVGTHADEIETSNLLYAAPEVVRLERARPELAPDRPGGLTRDPSDPAGAFSPTGAWGDPTLASAEKGKIVTEAIVEEIVALLRREFGA